MAPTLVLLHGFTHTGASWAPVVGALGERYSAVAPDIRGHGASSELRPVTLDAVVADVAGLTAGRFVLAGYSMGGRIALHAALAMPTRVERLLLIGASAGIADATERDRRRRADERLADEIERSTAEACAARWAATPVLADQPAAVLAATHADRLRSTPAGLAAALRGLGASALPPASGRLSELEMPVTLITGGRDAKFTEIARQMAAAIADANAVVVSGAGHAAHLERPREVAAIIGETTGR
jgi:2-succinyl-6-hydroxy-2,4-cyclohexadiene-1-carboxylate synthase